MFRATTHPEYIEVDGIASGVMEFDDFLATAREYQQASVNRGPHHRVFVNELIVEADPVMNITLETGPGTELDHLVFCNCDFRGLTVTTAEQF